MPVSYLMRKIGNEGFIFPHGLLVEVAPFKLKLSVKNFKTLERNRALDGFTFKNLSHDAFVGTFLSLS